MEQILIIGITGPNGTGKTTLAKMVAKHYGGKYYSVHQRLSKLFQRQKGEVPNDRKIFEDFTNSLRFESKDSAIAIKPIVDDILERNRPGVYIIESYVCTGEIDYTQKACINKATFILFGIDAHLQNRYEWTNRSKVFKRLNEIGIPNGEVMFATETSDWFDAKEWQPNIDACLERVTESNRFDNEQEGIGFVKKVFLAQVCPIIDTALSTPP